MYSASSGLAKFSLFLLEFYALKTEALSRSLITKSRLKLKTFQTVLIRYLKKGTNSGYQCYLCLIQDTNSMAINSGESGHCSTSEGGSATRIPQTQKSPGGRRSVCSLESES